MISFTETKTKTKNAKNENKKMWNENKTKTKNIYVKQKWKKLKSKNTSNKHEIAVLLTKQMHVVHYTQLYCQPKHVCTHQSKQSKICTWNQFIIN